MNSTSNLAKKDKNFLRNYFLFFFASDRKWIEQSTTIFADWLKYSDVDQWYLLHTHKGCCTSQLKSHSAFYLMWEKGTFIERKHTHILLSCCFSFHLFEMCLYRWVDHFSSPFTGWISTLHRTSYNSPYKNGKFCFNVVFNILIMCLRLVHSKIPHKRFYVWNHSKNLIQ